MVRFEEQRSSVPGEKWIHHKSLCIEYKYTVWFVFILFCLHSPKLWWQVSLKYCWVLAYFTFCQPAQVEQHIQSNIQKIGSKGQSIKSVAGYKPHTLVTVSNSSGSDVAAAQFWESTTSLNYISIKNSLIEPFIPQTIHREKVNTMCSQPDTLHCVYYCVISIPSLCSHLDWIQQVFWEKSPQANVFPGRRDRERYERQRAEWLRCNYTEEC